MQAVEVGTTDGNVTAVQGLEPGQMIATNNFNRLQEGIKVALRNTSDGTKRGNNRAVASSKSAESEL